MITVPSRKRAPGPLERIVSHQRAHKNLEQERTRLQRRRQHVAAIPRWRFRLRRKVESELLEEEKKINAWEVKVQGFGSTEADLEAVAAECFGNVWRDGRPGRRTRHPYHRDGLIDLESTIADLAPELSKVTLDLQNRKVGVTADGASLRTSKQPIKELEQVQPYLTADRFTNHVRQTIAYYMEIADDPVMLAKEGCVEGGHVLVVQHQASGLRARFTWTEGEQVGVVMSKPYEIQSLDPDDNGGGDNAYYRYGGLGIGRKLYRHAGDRHPDLRWHDGVLGSASGGGVRRALHGEDPYRWQSTLCEWCREKAGRVDEDVRRWWVAAHRTAFEGHPQP